EIPAAAQLVDPEIAFVAVAETTARHLDDAVGDGELGIEENVLLRVLAEQKRGGAIGREQRVRPALGQLGADVLEDDLRAKLRLIKELESLEVADGLGERLGERGEIQDRPLVDRVLEDELFGEDRLARARMPHDDVDGVRRKAAAEDGVGLAVARRQALGGVGVGLAPVHPAIGQEGSQGGGHRTATTVFAFINTSVITARKVDSTSGLRRKAAAPASVARAAAARILKIMTGTPPIAGSLRTSRHSVSPSIRGIRISVINSAGASSRTRSSADWPSSANSTANPALFKKTN